MQRFIKQNKLISAIIFVGLIVVLYLYFGPQDTPVPTAHTTTYATTSLSDETAAGSAASNVASETDIHFPRYFGSSRDPFIPGVALDNPSSGGPGSLIDGGKWTLTGINAINGVPSALVENSATNQSVFLQVGDRWSGLRVVSIGDDSVNFVNGLGQLTQLGFPVPQTPLNTPMAANIPSMNQINPLPPLTPDLGSQNFSSFRRNRGDQSNQ